MSLAEVLKARCKQSAESAAIIESDNARFRTLSFAQLEDAAARAAALLHAAGLRTGDGVLLFQPMTAELYVALAAIFRLGLVAIFIDPSAGSDAIDPACALYPPKALIATPKAHALRLVSAAVRRIPVKFSTGLRLPGTANWASYKGLPPLPWIHPSVPEAPALVSFTSGSTGVRKAAVRTHAFLLAQHRALANNLDLRSGERDLSTLPIFVLANLASGLTSIIPEGDLRRPAAVSPAPIVAQIKQLVIERTAASPAFLENLADYCRAQALTLPGLKKIYVGGAPVFPRLLAKLDAIAPNARIASVYGSTEAEPISRLACEEIEGDDFAAMREGRGLLAGNPVTEIAVRIIADQWNKPLGPFTADEFTTSLLPPGQPGEIVVSGAHVLPSYLNGRGDEENKFRVGSNVWHRTGDAGYIDAAGRLWLLGRCSARISDASGILYPFAVECAAHESLHVRRAAVLDYNGRRVLAIEPRTSHTKQMIVALGPLLRRALINELCLLRTIPVDRRHNAKVDYPALRKIIGSGCVHRHEITAPGGLSVRQLEPYELTR